MAKHASYAGPGVVDASAIKDKLVDLPPGGAQGLRRTKPGFKEVLRELSTAMAGQGDAAGIHPKIYEGLLDKVGTLEAIRALRPVADKLAQVLRETELVYEDACEADISRMVKAIDSTAQHDNPGVRAAFEKTLKYNSQIADKGVATRRKNEAARAADAQRKPQRDSAKAETKSE
ncbi:hypothetical protein [Polyangium aurulentum]|uniref:hypothetical protein n=1 Tax=Polyangium aurulentum TaxID=2567896 RepID=UPI0010AEB302|nr:hypothetical protein [Polyangium aurulentum]UQA58387.1 hypothetical protein E8A73_045275 [Polyangium aurulentum]